MSEFTCACCGKKFPTLQMVADHERLMLLSEPQPNPSDGGEKTDPVNHPKHYVSHPSGIECIQVTEFMGFNLGNAVKYVWRADLKNDALEDLRKAAWYIQREIEKREKAA